VGERLTLSPEHLVPVLVEAEVGVRAVVTYATIPIYPTSSCLTWQSGTPASPAFTPTYELVSKSRTTKSYGQPKQKHCGSEYSC